MADRDQRLPSVADAGGQPTLMPGPIPLWYQLTQHLQRQIKRGVFQSDRPFPPERALCAQYNVSRPTVQHAVAALVSEGWLERRRGSGTFLTAHARTRIARPAVGMQVWDITEQADKHAIRATIPKVIPANTAKADIVKHLRLTPTTSIMHIERVLMIDQFPKLIDSLYMPLAYVPDAEPQQWTEWPWLDVLAAHDVIIDELQETVGPVLLTRPEANLLQTQERALAARIRTTFFNSEGHPVAYRVAIVRGDRERPVLTTSLTARGVKLHHHHMIIAREWGEQRGEKDADNA